MIQRAIHLPLLLAAIVAASETATTKTIGDVMNEVSMAQNYLQIMCHKVLTDQTLMYCIVAATTWIIGA